MGSREWSIVQFHGCENMEHTDTNPESGAHYSLGLQNLMLSYYTKYHSAGNYTTVVSACLNTVDTGCSKNMV